MARILVIEDEPMVRAMTRRVTAMARIRSSHPELPLIAVSGCHRDDVSSQLEAAGLRTSVSWIAKPFAHDTLLAAVRSALAR